MKHSILSFFFTAATLSLVTATVAGASDNLQPPAKNVVIIVANGIRYNDAFGNKSHLYTDNIWNKLRPLGTVCTKFYNTECTYPYPAQTSLLSGVWQVVKNPGSDTIRSVVPTLFEYWKKKTPEASCYFAAIRKKQGILAYSNHPDFGKVFAPVFDTNVTGVIDTSVRKDAPKILDNTVSDKTLSYIFGHHPSFVYLLSNSGRDDEYHTEECKVKDEKEGCDESDNLNAYYESIILTDEGVYDFWNRIQGDGRYKDNSIFIFLSTHGRHTDDFHGYGDNCEGCRRLNLLIIGPGVKKNFISDRKRSLIDICRTVGTLCDVPTPLAKGDVMREILE